MTVEVDVVPPPDEVVVSETPVFHTMPPATPKFGALMASTSFVLLFVAQFAAGVLTMAVGMIVAVVQGRDINDPAFTATLIEEWTAPLLLISGVASALLITAVARGWAWHVVQDKSSEGAGFARATWTHVLLSCGVGALIAATYTFVGVKIIPFDPQAPLGPLATAASRGGVDRLAWAALALVFAPLFEEVFFRGLLLAGFARSWGSRAGAIIVTVLFVLMHLFETLRYWPATVAVTMLAIGTLAARRLTGSLIPAILFHWGYNAVIVIVAFAARGR